MISLLKFFRENGFTEASLRRLDGVQATTRERSQVGILHLCRAYGTDRGLVLFLKGWLNGSECSCSVYGGASWFIASIKDGLQPDSNEIESISLLIDSIFIESIGGKLTKVKTKRKISAKVDEKILSRGIRKDSMKKFYDVFKIGLEIEGEFFDSKESMRELTGNYLGRKADVTRDGSLNSNFSGHCHEIVTPVIHSAVEEKAFLHAMKKISHKTEDGNVAFAYANKSAGTHIHVSFSEKFMSEFKKNYGMEYGENFLRIFDSVEFEKLFFKRYFATFRLEKFWHRLQNRYCGSFLTATSDRIVDDSLVVIEKKKGESETRYVWLNYECLPEGQGFEIRIFPHLQTASGIKKVIAFTQKVLLEYMSKGDTKKRFDTVADFYKSKIVDVTKLSTMERMFYTTMNVQDRIRRRGESVKDRDFRRTSLDIMLFVAKISKKLK